MSSGILSKPKITSFGKGIRGITEEEFNRWLRLQLKAAVKVYSFNEDPKDAFWATEARITRKGKMKLEGLLYNVKEIKDV